MYIITEYQLQQLKNDGVRSDVLAEIERQPVERHSVAWKHRSREHMKVGSIVQLKVPCLGNPKGTCGVVYEAYNPGGYHLDRPHVSIIFPNGRYDGFSVDDQDDFLTFVRDSDLYYQFTNVIKLIEDFRNGKFAPYFTG